MIGHKLISLLSLKGQKPSVPRMQKRHMWPGSKYSGCKSRNYTHIGSAHRVLKGNTILKSAQSGTCS